MQRHSKYSHLKSEVLREALKPGIDMEKLAAEQNVSVDTLYAWRDYYFRKNTSKVRHSSYNAPPQFVEAKVIDDAPSVKKASFEFGNFTISIEGQFSQNHLQQLLAFRG